MTRHMQSQNSELQTFPSKKNPVQLLQLTGENFAISGTRRMLSNSAFDIARITICTIPLVSLESTP